MLGVKPQVIGESPYDYEWIRRKLFYRPEAIAVEIACWDIMAQAAGLPLYRLLGANGSVDSVPLAGYCFFRAPSQEGEDAVTLQDYVSHCINLQAKNGFQVLKLKLGAHHPEKEIESVIQVREAAGDEIELRADPNGSWSLPTALRSLRRLEAVDLQYLEEPVRASGPGDSTAATTSLKRLRQAGHTPIAADHCYRIDLLAQIIRDDAADIVLADLYGCGGIAGTIRYCQTANIFGLGFALHSGTELCVGQAAKLHIQAALMPMSSYASDAIYPEYVDGVLKGGKLVIEDGKMAVPQASGLGVTLDHAKLAQWELTDKNHRTLDAFWEETKASVGVDYPQDDLLTRHY